MSMMMVWAPEVKREVSRRRRASSWHFVNFGKDSSVLLNSLKT
jgi:hypothetical protein